MDEYASSGLEEIQQTKHSSTKLTPNEANDDKNHMGVKVNLTRREKNTRKYEEIKENYKVRKIEYDTTGNRTFQLEGLTKPFLRHEILKV